MQQQLAALQQQHARQALQLESQLREQAAAAHEERLKDNAELKQQLERCGAGVRSRGRAVLEGREVFNKYGIDRLPVTRCARGVLAVLESEAAGRDGLVQLVFFSWVWCTGDGSQHLSWWGGRARLVKG